MKRRYFIWIGLLAFSISLQGQTVKPLTYSEYQKKVNAGNLDYAAEQLNVSAAKADVVAAKDL